jgi:hypothetical protein
MPKEKARTLDPEIIEFIEDNVDLEPDQLLAQLSAHFGAKCQDHACYCRALTYLKEMYRAQGRTDLPTGLHQRLMECIQKGGA